MLLKGVKTKLTPGPQGRHSRNRKGKGKQAASLGLSWLCFLNLRTCGQLKGGSK